MQKKYLLILISLIVLIVLFVLMSYKKSVVVPATPSQTNSTSVELRSMKTGQLESKVTLIPREQVSLVVESPQEISDSSRKIVVRENTCVDQGAVLHETMLMSDFNESSMIQSMDELKAKSPLSVWLYEMSDGREDVLACNDLNL